MIKSKKLIGDGILLTATTLALKTTGVMFSSALTAAAGAEAMGLNSQIAAVYAFAVTAAAAGVNLGTMRLTAESRGAEAYGEIRLGVRRALAYCAKASSVIALILFIAAPFLANRLIGSADAVLPLRLLATVIPCISVSGAFHGYFNGVGRVYKSAAVNVLEQTVRITVTLAGLYSLTGNGSLLPDALTGCVGGIVYTLSAIGGVSATKGSLACLTVVIGSVAAEAVSCLSLTLLYLFDRRRYPRPTQNLQSTSRALSSKFLRITAPMAASALIRSGLSSAEHLLLPSCLRAFGSDSALAEYGTVAGMAIPVILYPMALMNAFAQLNTVDLAARISSGEKHSSIRNSIGGRLLFSAVYGIGCAAILSSFAYRISEGIFHSEDAGVFIQALSGYVVLAYIDHVADSVLKGLDQQVFVMRINILDSAIGLVCTAVFVPIMGIQGYILSLYICELINCAAGLGKLIHMLGGIPKLIFGILLPAPIAVITVKLLTAFGLEALPTAPAIVITATVYFAFIGIFLNLYFHKKGTMYNTGSITA